jgi:hypothetical protein
VDHIALKNPHAAMRAVSVPFRLEEIATASDILVVAQSPAGFLAHLSSTSLTVRSSGDPSFPVLSTFTRDPDSLEQRGSNHWVQWITRSAIAFGTCAGTIFISAVDDAGVIQPPVTATLAYVITGTFACHGSLGICCANCRIFFFAPSGRPLSSYQLQLGGAGFKGPHFHAPAALATVLDSKPLLVTIPSSAVSKKKKLTSTQFPDENVAMLAFNSPRSFLTAATKTGSVIAVQTQATLSPPGSDVIFLQWVSESILGILRRDGMFTLLDIASGMTTTTHVIELATATSLAFDEFTNSIVFTDGTILRRLELATLCKDFAFTCRLIFHYETGSATAAPVFPIRRVTKHTDHFVIASPFQLVIVSPSGPSPIVEIQVRQMAVWLDTVLVFGIDGGNYFLAGFDFTLNELFRVALSHAVHALAQCGEVIVISCHSKYSTVILAASRTDDADREVVPGHLFLCMREFVAREQLKNAFWDPSSGLLFHLWNDRLSGSRFVEDNIAFAFAVSKPALTIIQRSDGYRVVYRGMCYAFNGVCLFSDGLTALSPPAEYKFGEIRFEKLSFGHVLVYSHMQGDYDELLKCYPAEILPELLVCSIETVCTKEDSDGLEMLLEWLYEKPYAADVLEKSIGRLRQRQRNYFLNFGVEWFRVIESVSQQIRRYLFMYMAPGSLDEVLLEKAECARGEKEFIKEATERGKLIRVCYFCAQLGLDYSDFLRGNEVLAKLQLTEALAQIKLEAKWWKLGDDDASLRCLGTILEKSRLNVLAFSAFLVLGERPKMQALMLVDRELREKVAEFAEAEEAADYADIIREVLAAG